VLQAGCYSHDDVQPCRPVQIFGFSNCTT
jgi:hypothetical protein